MLLETVEPGCEIGLEACDGAHYWARKLQEQGFTVKLMAPQFVKRYVQSNKDVASAISRTPWWQPGAELHPLHLLCDDA